MRGFWMRGFWTIDSELLTIDSRLLTMLQTRYPRGRAGQHLKNEP